MQRPLPPRAGAARRVAFLAGLLLLCAPAPGARSAPGPNPRAWVPGPAADSIVAWAAEARAGFQANAGDSVGGPNYRAYERAGQISRMLLRALGPRTLVQARAIQPMLDSLGFDAEVAVDPAQTSFALVMVRNPFHFSAASVGYLYWWYRGQDLRMQGAVFRGGKEVATRVWWTGRADRPYEWAVIEHDRGNGPAHFTLFRLNAVGTSWDVAQSEEDTPLLDEPGEAVFADLNHDGTPEVVQWAIARTDSLFVPCSDCPRLMVEKTFVERQEGFVLQDSRVLPSPYATFVTFVRLLIDNNRAEAARLVSDPAQVTRALAAGWGVRRKPGTWQVEYGEPDERWWRWLEVRFDGPQGVRRYVVHFGQHDGRWFIQQWIEPKAVPLKSPVGNR